MAVGTGDRRVSAGQRKFRFAVIKRGRDPVDRAVANGTVLREAGRGVIRIGCAAVIGKVAGYARGRQRGVLAAAVAGRALQPRMRARKRKSGYIVIKRGWNPGDRTVANRTILWKIRRDMVGIRCLVEFLQVAPNTARRSPCKSAADMALQAVKLGMRARQGKMGQLFVVESADPAVCAVTRPAIG